MSQKSAAQSLVNKKNIEWNHTVELFHRNIFLVIILAWSFKTGKHGLVIQQAVDLPTGYLPTWYSYCICKNGSLTAKAAERLLASRWKTFHYIFSFGTSFNAKVEKSVLAIHMNLLQKSSRVSATSGTMKSSGCPKYPTIGVSNGSTKRHK